MTQSTVTIEGLTKLANDLITQNTAIRNKLDNVETQRDELLEVLMKAYEDIDYYGNADFNQTLIKIDSAIRKATGGVR